MRTSDDALLAGKYRLEEAIGTGGMGTVYRAVHAVLDRPVAVKLLNVAGSDPLLGERFLREARVAAAVRHPNVVDIVDFGTTPKGQPFMVMELLDGVTLWDRMLASPALRTEESIEILSQVLLGLEAVHRAGIIHRDLKPANIFVSPHDGELFARLLDFGISYSIDPQSRLRRGQFGTDERLIVGTPEYISPEQAEGRPDVDLRSDVYSMGVISYELLSGGQLPYTDANRGMVLFKVMRGGHVPLRTLRPDIPEIADVVEAALSHDRARRPATARELRRQLLVAAGRSSEHTLAPRRISLDEVTQSMPAPAPDAPSDAPAGEAAALVRDTSTAVQKFDPRSSRGSVGEREGGEAPSHSGENRLPSAAVPERRNGFPGSSTSEPFGAREGTTVVPSAHPPSRWPYWVVAASLAALAVVLRLMLAPPPPPPTAALSVVPRVAEEPPLSKRPPIVRGDAPLAIEPAAPVSEPPAASPARSASHATPRHAATERRELEAAPTEREDHLVRDLDF